MRSERRIAFTSGISTFVTRMPRTFAAADMLCRLLHAFDQLLPESAHLPFLLLFLVSTLQHRGQLAHRSLLVRRQVLFAPPFWGRSTTCYAMTSCVATPTPTLPLSGGGSAPRPLHDRLPDGQAQPAQPIKITVPRYCTGERERGAGVATAPHPRARLIDFRSFSKAGLPATMSKNVTPISAWKQSAD